MSDLISRLGEELAQAAERQAAGGARRRLVPGWIGRRSTRTLLLAGGATVALAGVGGAAGLLAGRGEVGGPPSLTYARLTPQQTAAGLRELTRPVVIGRGRQPHSGWRWQLVAFQTTSGLCVAIDFPQFENLGGGCAGDVPREDREIDWQGYLGRLGSGVPATLLGAVSPQARRVTLAHGHGRSRIAEQARIVRVADPEVLGAIGVRRPFALWIGEVTEANPIARAVAYDGAGRELGAVGVPNGGAGSAGFLPRGCELPRPDNETLPDVEIPLPEAVRKQFAVFRRAQRPDDRPEWLVRRLLGRERRKDGRYSTPFLSGFEGSIDLGGLRRVGTAPDGRPLFFVVTRMRRFRLPDHCMVTMTPRLRREEARQAWAMRRAERIVHLTLVDSTLRMWGGVSADRPLGGAGGYGGGSLKRPTQVYGAVADQVDTVELFFRGGTRRLVPIRSNLLSTTVPIRPTRIWIVRQVFRDRDGRIVAIQRRGR
jgi:hypothetical protein